MVVKTNFSREEITKIFANYNLGELKSFKPISKGTVQTNFLVKTTRGEYILRYYENRSMDSVLFETEVIEYLKEKGYPCPKPFLNNKEEYAGTFNKKPYVVFEFIEGKIIKKPNEKQKNQLIEKVAELHNLTKDFAPKHKSDRWNYDIKLCKKLAKTKAKKIGTKNAKTKFRWLKEELSKLDIPKSLPKGICHCDFDFSNVLFKNRNFNALLDFDDANYTYLIYDLACLIEPFIFSFTWKTWNKFGKFENIFDFKEPRGVVHEYQKYRQLSTDEKTHLFDVYKLSILLDCVWYFERGNVEDFYEKRKIDCLNNLGRERFYEEVFSVIENFEKI